MANAKLYDFKAWLETKDPNEAYQFVNCRGNCLMGQYMASKGQSWDTTVYTQYLTDVLGGHSTVLSVAPETFGGALERVKKVLEDA